LAADKQPDCWFENKEEINKKANRMLNFYGFSSCALLLTVAITLIVSNWILVRYIDREKVGINAAGQKKLLKRMTILFSVFFGIRAIYQLIYTFIDSTKTNSFSA
jgi:hypothetical protein